MTRTDLRAVTAGHNLTGGRSPYIRAIARGAHEELCGAWDAAGFDTKFAFITAAERMLATLEELGLDIFSFPENGWRSQL